jgi:DNA-binding MarR family transcriptional regulator
MSFAYGFNELIHAPYRLRICAMLSVSTAVEFGTLRDTLEVSDSVLSKHLALLTDANYITTKRVTGVPRRGRMWVSLTAEGRRAFQAHVQALQTMMADTWSGTAPEG